MKRLGLILFLNFILVSAYAEESIDYNPAIGFQFYNLPEKEKNQDKNKKILKNEDENQTLSYPAQMKLIQQKLEDARATAIMNPTTENIAVYKVYQDYFTEKASVFSSQWEKMLLEYPSLDYNIKNSHYNATASIKAEENKKKEKDAAKLINQHYGVFFFYRGNEALDNKLAQVVKSFSKEYGISIFAISMDGKVLKDFDNSKIDTGQAKKMNIKYFPALFLVNPKKEEYKPLAYGFISEDDLARRMLNVLTNFKPRI